MTTTKLDGLCIVTIGDKEMTRYKAREKSIPQWHKHLCTWGEAGTVKTGKKGKTGDRGVICMFVCYMDDHDGDVYGMWNPNTGRVTVTRDIIWLQRMYFNEEDTGEDFVEMEAEPDANTKTEDEENNDSSVSSADSDGSEKSSASAYIPISRTRSDLGDYQDRCVI